MLDANFIAENRPLVERIRDKPGGKEVDLDRVVALNAERKKLEHEGGQLRHEKKELGPKIQEAKKKNDPEAEKLLARSAEIKTKEKELDEKQMKIEDDLRAALLVIPNIPHEKAPRGDPSANRVR